MEKVVIENPIGYSIGVTEPIFIPIKYKTNFLIRCYKVCYCIFINASAGMLILIVLTFIGSFLYIITKN
jgi:hypothetical protein